MKLKKSKAKRNTVILSKIYAGVPGRAGNSASFSPNGWLITLFIIGSILLALSSCEVPIEDKSSHNSIIYRPAPAPHNIEIETEILH